MNIDNPVNQILLERGITQTKLAKKLKINRAHCSKVISRNRKSGPVEFKVAKFLNKKIEELFPDRKKNGPQAARVSSGSGSRPRQK